MMRNLWWKLAVIGLVVGLAGWSAYPPAQKIRLGLDLKGGMYLVLRVKTEVLIEQIRELEEQVRTLQAAVQAAAGPDAVKQARDRLKDAEASLASAQRTLRDAIDRALKIVRNRVDQFGVREASIQRQGRDRLVVQLPGETDRERARDLIGRTARLEFKLVVEDPGGLQRGLDGTPPEGHEVLQDREGESLLVRASSVLTGEALQDAYMALGEYGQPEVHLTLNAQGRRLFARVTGEHVGDRLAIVLDGRVYTAPVIQTRIVDGAARITGRFTRDEALDLGLVLRSGNLPAPIMIEEERTVGPTLGRDSIAAGVRATVVGGALVALFVAAYYLFMGLLADVALALNLVILLGILAYPPLGARLTLPGIAGIVLTLGMAVDANVLILERTREELQLGKSVAASLIAGYQKAFLTIFDANLTTLIAAVLLFRFGGGPIKGFAVTLSIGLIVSMFTAVFVTRVLVDLWLARRRVTRIPMFQLFRRPQWDFMRARKVGYVISLVVVGVSLASLGLRGTRALGIDFTGGALFHVRFRQPVATDAVRAALGDVGSTRVVIQDLGGEREFLIRSPGQPTGSFEAQLATAFPENPYELLRAETVGPAVGRELGRSAMVSLLLAFLGILAYVGFRFDLRSSVASVVALVHDVIVSAGVLSLAGGELSLSVIGALLTIAGFSINDTIVIFDRIRERKRTMGKATLPAIINASVNETLSRTVLTSGTVLIVMVALLWLGGPVLRDFSLTLLVGVIAGTYSTVFVASPLVVDWGGRRARGADGR